MDLGKKIREARARNKITLKDLAQDTGLTISFLSQVERGTTSPSLKSLRKISDALRVRLGSLFEEEQREIMFIRRYKEEKFTRAGIKSSRQVLASDMLNISMKPLIISIAPGATIKKELNSRIGEKFGIVLEGEFALYYDKQRFVMGKGDSIYCAYTKKPDKIVNIGRKTGKILLVSLQGTGQWQH